MSHWPPNFGRIYSYFRRQLDNALECTANLLDYYVADIIAYKGVYSWP